MLEFETCVVCVDGVAEMMIDTDGLYYKCNCCNSEYVDFRLISYNVTIFRVKGQIKMKLETTTVIGGIEVVDSGDKIMGHRIFVNKNESDYGLHLYVVDSKGNLKSKITVNAGCGQNVGYISDWDVESY